MSVKFPLDSATLDGCGFDNNEYTSGVPDVFVNKEDNGQAVVMLLSAELVLPTWYDDTAIGVPITPLFCTAVLSADVSAVNMFDVAVNCVMLGVVFDSAKTEFVRVVSCVACEMVTLDRLASCTFRLLNEMMGDIYYKSSFNKSAPKYHKHHQQHQQRRY